MSPSFNDLHTEVALVVGVPNIYFFTCLLSSRKTGVLCGLVIIILVGFESTDYKLIVEFHSQTLPISQKSLRFSYFIKVGKIILGNHRGIGEKPEKRNIISSGTQKYLFS